MKSASKIHSIFVVSTLLLLILTLAKTSRAQLIYPVILNPDTLTEKEALEQSDVISNSPASGGLAAYVTAEELAELNGLGLVAEILPDSKVLEERIATVTTLENQHLEVIIQDNGQFTMRTADGRYLLYPNGRTTNLSVRIGSETYTQKEGTLVLYAPLTVINTSTAAITYQTPEGVRVTLTYQLQGEALGLHLSFINDGSQSRGVKARFLLDTQVDINDGSPLYAPSAVHTYEADFSPVNFSLWRSYDFWPNYNLIGEGRLQTPPNRVVFGWWPAAYGTTWEYVPDPSRPFYTPGYITSPRSDSSVLLYYDLGNLSTGQTSALSTYYGTGSPEVGLDRERLIEKYAELRDAIKASIGTDLEAFAALEAKYHHAMKLDHRDYVETAWFLIGLALPGPGEFGTLGQATEVLDGIANVVEVTDLGVSAAHGLTGLLDDIPNSATEVQTRDDYIYPRFHNTVDFNGVTGVSGFKSRVNDLYDQYVAEIPNPLPDDYPLESTIALLDLQIAKLKSSQQGEVAVPVMAQNYCAEFKLGNLQAQRQAMMALAENLDFNQQVSYALTWSQIAYVGIGGAAKVAGMIVTGGTTAAVELVLWGGSSALGLISLPTTVTAMSEKDAMTIISLKAIGQLANDLPARTALMEETGKWIADPLFASSRGTTEADAVNLNIEEIVVPNVVVNDGALLGEEIARLTLRNNGSLSVNVLVSGQIVADTTTGSQIVNMAGSNLTSISPGQSATVQVPFRIFRSSLANDTGYDFQFYIYATDQQGGYQILGPQVRHFTAGTAAQIDALGEQTYETLQMGVFSEGQTIETSFQPSVGSRTARLSLTVASGSDADLHVYDEQNRHVGVNYATGEIELQIPGATYSGSAGSREWVDLTSLESISYTLRAISQYTGGGKDFDIGALEQPLFPAVLDSVPGSNWLFVRQTGATVDNHFNLWVSEAGGSSGVTGVSVQASDFAIQSGSVLGSSHVVCMGPSEIAAGSSGMFDCNVNVPGELPDGVYNGVVRFTGLSGGSTVMAETNVTLNVHSTVVSGIRNLYLPILLNGHTTPSQPLLNNGFEQGPGVGWVEYSSNGWPIVTHVDGLPNTLPAPSGQWAAWLGGAHYEISYIEQVVTVPTDRPYLTYSHFLASEDYCGYDLAGTLVNSTVVDVYDLCQDTNSTVWSRRSVDLSAYRGQTVALQIRVETDGSLFSSLYVDDVGFSASPAAAQTQSAAPQSTPGELTGRAGPAPQAPPGPAEPRRLR